MTSPFYENNQEALQREVNQSMLYLNSGATTVRVLPTWKEGGVYFKEFREHFIRADNRNFYIPCSESGPCALCDECDRLEAMGDERSMELATALDVTPRCLFNVVLIDAPASDNRGVKGNVYAMKAPITVQRAIVRMDRDEAGGWYDVTSPFHGVNLRIIKEGKDIGTRYTVLPTARTNISEFLASIGVNKTMEQIFNEMHDLDNVLAARDYDDVVDIINRSKRRSVRQPIQKPTEVPVTLTNPPAPAPPTAPPNVVQQIPVAVPPPAPTPTISEAYPAPPVPPPLPGGSDEA